MTQTRKGYTPEEKVAVLRRHLLEKTPVSDLCQELGLHPSLFYHRLKEFFEHATAAFERRSRGEKQQQDAQQRRIAALEHKLKAKNEAERLLMLDADVVAVSPTSVGRVLHRAGYLGGWNHRASGKGKGFQQPQEPHPHWHVDVSYLHLAGTFYYLCSVLDGYSRFIVH